VGDSTGVVCTCSWGWHVSISHTPSVSLPRGEGMEPVEDEAFTCNVSLGIPSCVNTTSLSMTFALRPCAISPRSRPPLTSTPTLSHNTRPKHKSADLALTTLLSAFQITSLGRAYPHSTRYMSADPKTIARWHTSRRQTPASYTMRTKGSAQRSKETRCCRGRSRPTAGAVF